MVGANPKKCMIQQMLKDYKETQFGREGFLKRYSKDYNVRRQNGKTVDLEEDYPDYVDKFEFIAYVIDKNLNHLDHEVPNPKMFDKIIDEIERLYTFLNCKGNPVISPSNILDAVVL